PLAMVNAWYIKNPPWKQINTDKNNADKLETNWQALEDRCRTIIGWRMQLIPYLQAAFARYARDGMPPFRPFILDYPEDDALRTLDDAYIVGDRMLVAPMFAGEEKRSLRLPTGTWHNFWTGAPTDGGQTLDFPATTERIPVFVKAGSVFPLGGVADSTQSPAANELTVQVYGDGSLSWSPDDRSRPMLRWDAQANRGVAELTGTEYKVTAWKHMG
ncbi:MAG TPA: hypothetical protein VF018_17230, partial [Acidobacteriaceae bacterium]